MVRYNSQGYQIWDIKNKSTSTDLIDEIIASEMASNSDSYNTDSERFDNIDYKNNSMKKSFNINNSNNVVDSYLNKYVNVNGQSMSVEGFNKCYPTDKTIYDYKEDGKISVSDPAKQQSLLVDPNNIVEPYNTIYGDKVYIGRDIITGQAQSFFKNDSTTKNTTSVENASSVSETSVEEPNYTLKTEKGEKEKAEFTKSLERQASLQKLQNVLNEISDEGNIQNIQNRNSAEINQQLENLRNNSLNKINNFSKKVSLNIAPINKSINITNYMGESEWNSRLGYVLGDSGFLYNLFGPTNGIVFPYTPKINFEHSVNYEETEILHSNLKVNHYKNTPPPSITLTAEFTADGNENTRYMYGVMHFLRAVSKCEFGEEVFTNRKEQAGVPPPILYLNGWGNLINNIPVVIKSFGINLDNNKHYVHLLPEDVWLPTDISINIQMGIQFNLDKYKHQFDLDKYKKNILDATKFNTGTLNIIEGKTYQLHKGLSGNQIYKSSEVRKYNGSGWTW